MLKAGTTQLVETLFEEALPARAAPLDLDEIGRREDRAHQRQVEKVRAVVAGGQHAQRDADLKDLLKNGSEGRFITFRVGIADVVPKFIAHRLLAPVLEVPVAGRLVCQADRLDMVLADRPMPPGTSVKGYSRSLAESGVAGQRERARRRVHPPPQAG
jgi:hypothetical protein